MSRLKITINSFSYRQGIPDDPSGNGGGHVFDCRAITNPGTLTEYKALSGRDAPVIAFLKEHSKADRFVDNAFQIVEQSIEAYLQAGYTHLMVSFGCTGGQHRSVYCAETLAARIRARCDVDLTLVHHEQRHWFVHTKETRSP